MLAGISHARSGTIYHRINWCIGSNRDYQTTTSQLLPLYFLFSKLWHLEFLIKFHSDKKYWTELGYWLKSCSIFLTGSKYKQLYALWTYFNEYKMNYFRFSLVFLNSNISHDILYSRTDFMISFTSFLLSQSQLQLLWIF